MCWTSHCWCFLDFAIFCRCLPQMSSSLSDCSQSSKNSFFPLTLYRFFCLVSKFVYVILRLPKRFLGRRRTYAHTQAYANLESQKSSKGINWSSKVHLICIRCSFHLTTVAKWVCVCFVFFCVWKVCLFWLWLLYRISDHNLVFIYRILVYQPNHPPTHPHTNQIRILIVSYSCGHIYFRSCLSF